MLDCSSDSTTHNFASGSEMDSPQRIRRFSFLACNDATNPTESHSVVKLVPCDQCCLFSAVPNEDELLLSTP
jgi:hypothetical protein